MRAFDRPGRSPVIAENGMAATSHPLGTATALEILREGGNAADAALAASATLAVVEPHMTGIGGDCFAIVAEPDGTLHGLNGSGRAPASVDPDWYRERAIAQMPRIGAHSVTAPGAVRAWEMLAGRFGTLGLDRLFADAVRYAQDGFAIHQRVAWDWPRFAEEMAEDEGARRHYLADGRAPKAGTRWHSPALARTLQAIARGGADAFYEGPVAAEIAATVRAKGGFLSEEDLAAVTAEWVSPLSVPYGDHALYELPPNGQGVTALILANLLQHLGAGRLGADSAERLHMEIEAGRLAYAVRDHLVADPDAMTVPAEHLLSDAYAASLAAGFDPERRNPSISLPPAPDSDTVYLTVVDRDRRAVSFINSLYGGFGARIVTPDSGVTLQNRGSGFTLEPGHPNELGPGKRPMHTIIPAMATRNGRPAITFGVMGGAYQPMGHASLLSSIVDHGMDPQAAIDLPRIFWSGDGTLEAESGICEEARRELAARGHAVRDVQLPFGGAQAIVIDAESGFLIAGSDPRKDGLALGW